MKKNKRKNEEIKRKIDIKEMKNITKAKKFGLNICRKRVYQKSKQNIRIINK